uniref:Tyr recombinase domain-containing protein n=1 Tax=Moniliophthora roreri TaxID=221103 RepID=A0A0W0FHW3_MONRR
MDQPIPIATWRTTSKSTTQPLAAIFSHTKVFLQRLADAAKAKGLEPLQGHGIRIGATLEYLLRGVPFDVVKSTFRWKSDAFLTYLRKHAEIMAPYMQPQLHQEFIQYIMPPVQ